MDEDFDIGLINLIQFNKDTNFSSVIECKNQKNLYRLTKNVSIQSIATKGEFSELQWQFLDWNSHLKMTVPNNELYFFCFERKDRSLSSFPATLLPLPAHRHKFQLLKHPALHAILIRKILDGVLGILAHFRCLFVPIAVE